MGQEAPENEKHAKSSMEAHGLEKSISVKFCCVSISGPGSAPNCMSPVQLSSTALVNGYIALSGSSCFLLGSVNVAIVIRDSGAG